MRTLEENGIGRPSTYAPILSTLQERGYVLRENKRLSPTETGILVNDLITEHFANIINVEFTVHMEEDLDKIAGCIRVAKAFELAELVLDDPVRWKAQTMAEVVATGTMQTVNLARPVPVLILYWTVQPRPDGQVIFRNDVYGRDKATLAALDAPFRASR